LYSQVDQIDPVVYPSGLKQAIEKADNDSIRIEKLFDLAFFYYDYEGEDERSDSLSGIAVRLAEESHRPELMVIAYCRYLESNNLFANYSKALGYALKAEKLSAQNNPGEAFRLAGNTVSVYISGYDYDRALEYSYKSLSIATTTENTVWKAESYLDIGKSLEGKNQKIEAFRNYLNATVLAERIKDTSLLVQCFSRLSKFYNLNKLYNQATH
jgi:hypothetical protein